ncbi:hypothetical protein EV586_101143 [Tumebacillus sp. BK434]|uniref:hypothetical protein n=1 Tax=Tumebacillus sp. BK434 TaxID=2512169 RepID=UPI001043A1CB|nr:hypothetical protein [Tumebacillus sp. BK434]TCP58944.1 hypothetical protein EV586_101143 [Tumebacillus sp. BK434]
MAGKKAGAKKKTLVDAAQRQQQMPIVTVDTCLKCPSVCVRGAAYMEKMSKPGSIGFGVPCILRRK